MFRTDFRISLFETNLYILFYKCMTNVFTTQLKTKQVNEKNVSLVYFVISWFKCFILCGKFNKKLKFLVRYGNEYLKSAFVCCAR